MSSRPASKSINGLEKYDNAHDRIKELLFRRILNPGQKLLYKDLCELLGMSKTPIINALNQLIYEGFVTYEHNRGYRVATFDETSITHLFEVRLELECINVRNAVEQFTKEKFAILKEKYELLASYTTYQMDIKRLNLDMSFHAEIARMGGNTYSLQFLKTVMEHTYFMLRLERAMDGRKKQMKDAHKKVVDAIENRDAAKAVKAISIHVNKTHTLMSDYLNDLKQKEENFWI